MWWKILETFDNHCHFGQMDWFSHGKQSNVSWTFVPPNQLVSHFNTTQLTSISLLVHVCGYLTLFSWFLLLFITAYNKFSWGWKCFFGYGGICERVRLQLHVLVVKSNINCCHTLYDKDSVLCNKIYALVSHLKQWQWCQKNANRRMQKIIIQIVWLNNTDVTTNSRISASLCSVISNLTSQHKTWLQFHLLVVSP